MGTGRGCGPQEGCSPYDANSQADQNQKDTQQKAKNIARYLALLAEAPRRGEREGAQNQSSWRRFLNYFYIKRTSGGKGENNFGITDVKVGPLRVDASHRKGTTEYKRTIDTKAVSTVDENGVKAGIGPFKFGLDRTTTQEDGKPPVTETTKVFSLGKVEGSNGEFGIGVGGCFMICSQIEVGIQVDEVLHDVKELLDNADPGPNANVGPGTQPN